MSPWYFILSTMLPGAALGIIIGRRAITGARGVGLAFGLGSALVTLELFLYFVIFRLSYSPFILWFMGAQTIVAAAVLAYKISWNKRFEIQFSRIKPLTWILGIIVAAILCLSLFQALGKPPAAFDSIAFWAMRAEILLKQGSVDFNPESATYLSALSHANYPWHLSLLEYWNRLLGSRGGQLNIIAWLYFASLIFVLSDFAVKKLGQVKGLLLSVFVASQPLVFYHASNNYADLIVGYYAATGFMFFLEWLSNKKLAYLALGSFFFGWTFSIKNYGTFYIGALALGLGLAWLWHEYKFSIRSAAVIVLSWFGAILPIAFFKIFFKLNLHNTEPQNGWHPEALYPFWQSLFTSGSWNIWWIIVLVVALISAPAMIRNTKLRIAWCMFLALIIVLLGVFSLTENYMWALDHTALSRAFLPLVPFSAALLVFTLETYESRKHTPNF